MQRVGGAEPAFAFATPGYGAGRPCRRFETAANNSFDDISSFKHHHLDRLKYENYCRH